MNPDKPDNDELLKRSLEAMQNGRDDEAMDLLQALLQRDPGHLYGRYLIAAQHAQMGLFDQAETGLRAVVAESPDFAIARFQLGQLLLLKDAGDEARRLLEPLAGQGDALGAYARGLTAAAAQNLGEAVRELQAGLSLTQEIPALAADMQRLGARLQEMASLGHDNAGLPDPTAAAPMLLANYGRDL